MINFLNGVAVDDVVLLQNRRFHQTSAQFWSQNVPLALTKKTSTHTLCYWSLKLPSITWLIFTSVAQRLLS